MTDESKLSAVYLADFLMFKISYVFRPVGLDAAPRSPADLRRQVENTDRILSSNSKRPPSTRAEIMRLTNSRVREEKERQQRREKWRAPSAGEEVGRVFFSADPKRQQQLGEIVNSIPLLEDLEADETTRGRLARRAGLSVAIELLRRLPVETLNIEIVIDLLTSLEQQLADLDAGHVALALRRTRRPRGRPKNLVEQGFELRCVLAANALTETGTKSSDANKILFPDNRHHSALAGGL